MDTRSCKNCRALFNYLSGDQLCPKCSKDIERKYASAKLYIYDHPAAGLLEVSSSNDVSVAQLQRWMRENKLQFSDASSATIECEKCKKPIKSGKYCPQCAIALKNTLNSFYKK
jgi:Zn finger protein HypA/HybF involved in hydrogenase expression